MSIPFSNIWGCILTCTWAQEIFLMLMALISEEKNNFNAYDSNKWAQEIFLMLMALISEGKKNMGPSLVVPRGINSLGYIYCYTWNVG